MSAAPMIDTDGWVIHSTTVAVIPILAYSYDSFDHRRVLRSSFRSSAIIPGASVRVIPFAAPRPNVGDRTCP